MPVIKQHFYIDGQWQTAASNRVHKVINPATENVCASVPMATEDDVNAAIDAARRAFDRWSNTSAQQRCNLINAAADEMQRRAQDFADAITMTMGCPTQACMDIQVQGSIDAFRSYADRAFMMDECDERENVLIFREAVGVCAMISPWNYPLSQLIGKIAPALAAGCTMVVKPAEQTPIQDFIIAEVFDNIGLPAGVFNLVTGYGHEIGPVMSSHPDVDMVSFTGSTRAGVSITESAAPTIKRVCLELGGKSPYIIAPGAELEKAVRYGVEDVMSNTGQTCTALTRMLVPQQNYQQVLDIAKAIAEDNVVGDPQNKKTTMGPMSSQRQKDTVLDYIRLGIEEGARIVSGGTSMPEGVNCGAYVMPTIFADVTNTMRIAKEEIFGPVLCIIPYENIEEAITIANASVYGLSSAVYAENDEAALRIASRIRAGQCFIQGSFFSSNAPFGGFKQSGNGREWGDEGLLEYVELRSVITQS